VDELKNLLEQARNDKQVIIAHHSLGFRFDMSVMYANNYLHRFNYLVFDNNLKYPAILSLILESGIETKLLTKEML